MRVRMRTETASDGRRAPGGFYLWRDPSRCSPARLEALRAHDDYIRALEKLWSAPYAPKRDRRSSPHGFLRQH